MAPVLGTGITQVQILHGRPSVGDSPSGKASDFDSDHESSILSSPASILANVPVVYDWLGHDPFKVGNRVRLPVGTPNGEKLFTSFECLFIMFLSC